MAGKRRIFVVFCMILICFSHGCSIFLGVRHTLQEAEIQVKEAQEHFDVVKSLEVETSYQDEFKKAKGFLEEAQAHLKSKRTNKAYLVAENSLKVSKGILKAFYLDTITQLARKAKTELQKKAGEDQDNPLTDYLPKIDTVLEDAEKVKKDEKILSLTQVLDDLKEVLKVTYSIHTSVAKTLGSDISFDKGEYQLAERGKQLLKKLITRILADKNAYIYQYPGKIVTTKIKVVGYTDQLNFSKETEQILLKNIETKAPLSQPERRRFLNQHLSELRAKSIIEYIKEVIVKTEQKDSRFKVDTESVGRGEDMPANLSSPYPTADPRRRICKIYTYTTVY